MSVILSHILAAAILVNARQIQSGEHNGKTVSVRGSVVSVVRDEIDNDYNWIIMDTPFGKIYAAADERSRPLEELKKLTDSEIELTGLAYQFTSWRSFLGNMISFGYGHDGEITVLQPAPDDPFSVPDMDTDNALHRRKTAGRVVAVTSEHFFLRATNQSILRVNPADDIPFPEVGLAVTVSGFPKHGQSTPQLDNAVWRLEKDSAESPETAESIDVSSLYVEEGNRRYANNSLCGKVIKLVGIIEAAPVQNALTPAALFLNCSGTSIKIDLSGLGDIKRKTPPVGSTVEIAGLCYADFSSTEGNPVFPRLEGFTLIPRTNGDIRILRSAPWWTPIRLLVLIGVLIVVIGLFAGWIIALRIVSARRARALAREQIASARAEFKVEERTHLAVELHDSLSQTLTGVALQIDAAAGANDESAKRFLSTARNMLASCRQELNGCLWDLRSRTFEEKDMTEAVQRTLTPHLGSAKLTVRFNVPRKELSEATAHAVLRVVRELGVNAVKHGHAANIKVAGEFHDDIISFSVQDDGQGFDPNTAPGPAQGHFGLQGIRERLNDFNGTLRCDSEPGQGAKFIVTLHTTGDITHDKSSAG